MVLVPPQTLQLRLSVQAVVDIEFGGDSPADVHSLCVCICSMLLRRLSGATPAMY